MELSYEAPSAPAPLDFADVAILPSDGLCVGNCEDNVAICKETLKKYVRVRLPSGTVFTVRCTILEGHRFAVRKLEKGEQLRSWGLPFGETLRAVAPGEYLCNETALAALRSRTPRLELPSAPNFANLRMDSLAISEARFEAAMQVALLPPGARGSFDGYFRGGGRGTGTRNCVVVIGTTARTAGFARRLAESVKSTPGVDSVVAVAHSEGGGRTAPNNLPLLVRTLAHWIVHPNVGAALVVDYGDEQLTCAALEAYMTHPSAGLERQIAHSTFRFMTLTGGFTADIAAGQVALAELMRCAASAVRSKRPVAELRFALQCGGSDAFSGVSANPLVGSVARLLIERGGAALQAETDELMGAESYFLSRCRDELVARKFLDLVERFKHRLANHDETPEGNPSGGNVYRGLYNIALKSLGAGMKKAPDVRLDGVGEYGERTMEEDRGFYFMDSPGNDLESIAGQVAAGCNVIFFTTGSGSATNFPFVPTLKVVTTSKRHALVGDDMDINAGEFLDGKQTLKTLAQSAFDLALRIASGEKCAGERNNHYQVSIWREWSRPDDGVFRAQESFDARAFEAAVVSRRRGERASKAVSHKARGKREQDGFVARLLNRAPFSPSVGSVALILPTSLCASEVARQCADALNSQLESGKLQGLENRITSFVSLPHTEGCGCAGKDSDQIFADVVLGHIAHCTVAVCAVLEHGCEKKHNDFIRIALQNLSNLPPLMYASVQEDGGCEQAKQRVCTEIVALASAQVSPSLSLPRVLIDLNSAAPLNTEVRFGIAVMIECGEVCDRGVFDVLLRFIRRIVASGCYVVLPSDSPLLIEHFDGVSGGLPRPLELRFGQCASTFAQKSKVLSMKCFSRVWPERVAGAGATGVQLIVAFSAGSPLTAHPLVPTIVIGNFADADISISDGDDELLRLVAQVASREIEPLANKVGNTHFQLDRGELGVSL